MHASEHRAWARRGAAAVSATAMLVALVPAASTAAPAKAQGCDNRDNNTVQKLLDCVTVEGAMTHLQAFQDIADAHGGIRASGTPGYDASADYVAATMEKAGYLVSRQFFDFAYFSELSDAVLEIDGAAAETGTYSYSGSGDVTGSVTPVDLALTGSRASSSGCEAADFAGLDLTGAHDIALIQRGACTFAAKALNAQAAGAEAVVIFNQGTPGRTDLIVGTLGSGSAGKVTIPVVGASFATGETLAAGGHTVRVATETVSEVRRTQNVFAETPGGNPRNVVMAGAHLDSVGSGPGINDNGSGSAALLEVAHKMRKAKTDNKVRYAWWGAEESGLVGSWEYVNTRTPAELDDIALYLNFDMVGSPNHIWMIYDADQSTHKATAPVPAGSAAIEDVLESFFTSRNAPYDDAAFSGRSDYAGFLSKGIPSGGLFTGAEVAKTPLQASIWGGTAGVAFDPCYHAECDTIANVSATALDVNLDAIAYSVMTFAYSTESVNGVAGRTAPGATAMPAPAGAQGTFSSGGGGGHDHAEE